MNHLGFPIETVAVFVILSVSAIAIDLFAHRDNKPMSLKSAAIWSLFWVLISVLFGAFLWVHHGSEAASLFFTGYALEKVLSVDNLFLMMAVFAWFKVPEGLRHRVLYWGIIGAIIFRMIFVAIGAGLLALGPIVEVVFAVIVGYTAVMMLRRDEEEGEEDADYSEHLAYRAVHRFFPVFPRLYGSHFFLKGEHLKNRDYIIGNSFTALDLYYSGLILLLTQNFKVLPADETDVLQRYAAKHLARPAFAETMAWAQETVAQMPPAE